MRHASPLAPLLPPLLLLAGCPQTPVIEISGGADYTPEALHALPGLAVVPNIDDDNNDGTADWDDGGRAGEDDERAHFLVEPEAWRGLKRAEELRLVLGGDAASFRIYLGSAQVMGALAETVTSYVLDTEDVDDALVFDVEVAESLAMATVTLEHLDRKGEVLESDRIWMTGAPLVLNHHLQPTEEVWALEVPSWAYPDDPEWNNDSMIDAYGAALGDAFTSVPGDPYWFDVWMQDEFQFASFSGVGQRIDVVIDSIRNREVDDWAEDTFPGPGDEIVRTWGVGIGESVDSFGNLEVSPPLDADGIDYPLGRIYFGGSDDLHPTAVLTDFLASQRIQAPLRIDTTWLCVGHVDEFMSFVPDPSAPRAFRFVYTDTRSAWDIVDAADPDTELPRFGGPPPWSGHGIGTVGEFANDDALRFLNEDAQEDWLDPILEQLREEFGLLDEEIVPLPGIFEEPWGCDGYLAALVPGMVNLVEVNLEDGGHVIMPDPFFRDANSSSVGQDEDPFIAAVQALMPEGLALHFVDDWFVYHMGLGEVHCGTNWTSTPLDWWVRGAGHLLQEEE